MSKLKSAAKAVVETVKRFTQRAQFTGGDGAKVTVYIKENKHGEYNVGATLREPTKKAAVGCPAHVVTLDEAIASFNVLTETALAHGWTKKEKKARSPKAPAFTVETFPTAKPSVGGVGLAFPKGGKKK